MTAKSLTVVFTDVRDAERLLLLLEREFDGTDREDYYHDAVVALRHALKREQGEGK